MALSAAANTGDTGPTSALVCGDMKPYSPVTRSSVPWTAPIVRAALPQRKRPTKQRMCWLALLLKGLQDFPDVLQVPSGRDRHTSYSQLPHLSDLAILVNLGL